MRLLPPAFVTLALVFWSAPAEVTGGPKMAQMVTIRFVDHFGKPWTACHVEEFAPSDGEVGPDYASRFEGVTGRNIPFGRDYRLGLACAETGPYGPFFVSVGRPQQFILISAWHHAGDYYTGLSPRLTVSIAACSREKLGQAWVKVIGVYLDDHEIDTVHPESRAARFYDIVPGTYLVLLLTGERLACVKQIQLLEAHGRLELSLTPKGCEAKGLSLVRVID